METAGLLIGMAAASVVDIRKKKIPLILMLVLIGFAFIMHFLYGRLSIIEMAFGAVIGVFLLIISLLSHEKIGLGDGIIFVAVGLFLGFFGSLMVLWYSSLISAIAGLVILIVKKKKKEGIEDVTLPFAPCVLVGIILYVIRNGGVI